MTTGKKKDLRSPVIRLSEALLTALKADEPFSRKSVYKLAGYDPNREYPGKADMDAQIDAFVKDAMSLHLVRLEKQALLRLMEFQKSEAPFTVKEFFKEFPIGQECARKAFPKTYELIRTNARLSR